ncbi:MAG: hypothetical protein IPG64_26160 [Haliea sp.]|nr:hypothetical protein [Haliea sp.]
MLLGEAQAAAVVSLFDLAEGVDPVVGNTLLRKAIGNRMEGPSFSTVINLAVLLQTLDSDGNPDNGIEISADVAALFEPDSVNLNRHWQDFIHDQGFRRALMEAKASALLDGGRQIRKPWQAMAHLYASLGIDSKLKPVTGNVFSDASGFSNYSATQEFDAEGKLAQVWGASGFINASTFTYAYDANGNLIREQRDSLFPSGTDGIYFHLYDGDGNLVRREVGTDGDETPGTGIDAVYEYVNDAQGRRLLEDFDTNGDGVPESSTAYFYDTDGNPLRNEYDSDGDGTPDSTNSFVHDAVGIRCMANTMPTATPCPKPALTIPTMPRATWCANFTTATATSVPAGPTPTSTMPRASWRASSTTATAMALRKRSRPTATMTRGT